MYCIYVCIQLNIEYITVYCRLYILAYSILCTHFFCRSSVLLTQYLKVRQCIQSCVWTGTNRQGVDVLHVPRPTGAGDLASIAGRIHFGLCIFVCRLEVHPVRVAQPQTLEAGRQSRQHVFNVEQRVVRHGHVTPSGLWNKPEGWTKCRLLCRSVTTVNTESNSRHASL